MAMTEGCHGAGVVALDTCVELKGRDGGADDVWLASLTPRSFSAHGEKFLTQRLFTIELKISPSISTTGLMAQWQGA